ncbi:MAG TPA: hypothetical protein VNX29_04385 [Kaistia sp.]|nr:hypothetical protein [Kaistia sp.]
MTSSLVNLSPADAEAALSAANEIYAAFKNRGLVRREQEIFVLRVMLAAAIVDTSLAASIALSTALCSPSDAASRLVSDTAEMLARYVDEILEHQGAVN